ncbi:MAG TPA: hypothetical protein VI688_03160 [Anaerolineales bacterium]|nr:hypothetical protein [Anaerolineales bacterium]
MPVSGAGEWERSVKCSGATVDETIPYGYNGRLVKRLPGGETF